MMLSQEMVYLLVNLSIQSGKPLWLAGADLSGMNLEGAPLAGAYLAGANLKKTNLRGANLQGADLDGAELEGASYDDTTRWPTNFEPGKMGAKWRRGQKHPRVHTEDIVADFGLDTENA
jgi:uncharacterized protein YjbI with pentapeptide repeats